MSYFDNQPLRYFRGRPVYLTTYLTIALTVGIIVTVLLMSARVDPEFLIFYPSAFLRGRLWQPFTYLFVNPISFFTPLGIFCFYIWGVEVEQFLGRRRFVAVCAALVATPVLYCLALYFFGVRYVAEGDFLLLSALLVTYATIYPNLEYFGWLLLKWFAFACILCGSLMFFPARDWFGLGMLWVTCFVGFASIQFARGNFHAPQIRMPSFRRKPKFRVMPSPSSSGPREEEPGLRGEHEAVDSINPILDKIAKSGLNSLTAAERAKLEKARKDLMQ